MNVLIVMRKQKYFISLNQKLFIYKRHKSLILFYITSNINKQYNLRMLVIIDEIYLVIIELNK